MVDGWVDGCWRFNWEEELYCEIEIVLLEKVKGLFGDERER